MAINRKDLKTPAGARQPSHRTATGAGSVSNAQRDRRMDPTPLAAALASLPARGRS